jgi:hypothetical protein
MQVDNKDSLISTNESVGELYQRLKEASNQRIIVSGVFGIGKTTFLKHFSQKFKDEFISIHLFPVNYSIAKNEDIFELIKYDILYCLFQFNPEFKKLQLSWYDSLIFLKAQEIYRILADFVSLIPKFGKDINSILSSLNNLVNTFTEIQSKKKAELEIDEVGKIVAYAQKMEGTIGGLYENDFYSRLIEDLINRIKVEDVRNPKQVVLIVDDLDRVDPEHVFRLLNVFAAHFDVNARANKFSIDKIILCCDIENIRRIFVTKYGAEVDFNGYIDKFFSRGIFTFKNHYNVIKALPSLIRTIKPNDDRVYIFNETNHLNGLLRYMLRQLLIANSLNLRVLFKFVNANYAYFPRSIMINNSLEPIWRVPVMTLFEFLIDCYGDFESLHSAILKIEFDATELHNSNLVLGDLCLAAAWNGSLPGAEDDPRTFGRHFYNEKQRYNYTIIRHHESDKFIYHGSFAEVTSVDATVQKRILLRGLTVYGSART